MARVDLRWVEIHDALTCSNFILFPIHPLAIDIKHVDNWWPALRPGEGRDAGGRLRTEGASKSQLQSRIEGVTQFVFYCLIALHASLVFTIGYQFKLKAKSVVLNKLLFKLVSGELQGGSVPPLPQLYWQLQEILPPDGVEVFVVESRWGMVATCSRTFLGGGGGVT